MAESVSAESAAGGVPPASEVIAVRNLRVDIPVSAGILHPVRGVSFSVARGETLAIVGESGCGKSLTSLALMGLLPKSATRTADRMELLGTDLRNLSERKMAAMRGGRMAMIFQEPMTSLNPVYTIGSQLTEVYRKHVDPNRAAARRRAIDLLERVGISSAASRLGQYPHQLSGGLRQRVMIAMALMCSPDLIIADEPTTALDVTIQAQILHLLSDLQREFEMGMILITHDLGIVARVADKVQVMYAGKTVEEGSVDVIFDNPMHPYTQGLLRCIPVPGKTRRGERLGSVPGIVPNLVGELRGCLFRNRCPFAVEACASWDDEFRLADGHAYNCIRPPEVAATAEDDRVQA